MVTRTRTLCSKFIYSDSQCFVYSRRSEIFVWKKFAQYLEMVRLNLPHLPVPKFNEKPITRTRGISMIVLKYRHANCTDLIGANCTKSEQFNNQYREIATNWIQKTSYNPCMIIKLNSDSHAIALVVDPLFFENQIVSFKISIITYNIVPLIMQHWITRDFIDV